MTYQIKPLLITPLPKAKESLMGLILRTSEENGYTSPTQILRYAGLSENEIRSVNPPLNKIAQLYARKPKDFSDFGIHEQGQKKRIKKWRILNHIISGFFVNVKSTRLCPECVQESGFVDAFGELKFALVCSKHRRELIDTCSSCNKMIRWQRMGLLKCKCGHDLSSDRGEIVEDKSVLNITELIIWKLSNHEHDESNLIQAGFPLTELRELSLSTLLGIIERLQPARKRKTSFTKYPEVSPKLNVLKQASNMLANWPTGFYEFLENLSPDNRNIASRNVNSRYRSIYYALFKTGFPENEVKFMKKAFVNFANEILAQDAYIDVRISNQAETERRYVGILGLSEHLNIHPATLRKYIKKGLLKPEIRESMGRARKVFDIHKLPFRAREGNYLKQRDAISFLQISLGILNGLKANGIYKIYRLAWGTDGYSELDLQEFKASLLNKAPKFIEHLTIEQMRLKEFFRIKNIPIEIKIKTIGDIVNGTIVPVGRTGNEIPNIVLTKLDIKKLTSSELVLH